jgi:hypothetical protein
MTIVVKRCNNSIFTNNGPVMEGYVLRYRN